jgi:tetratricopeptide (TPR) repeat protein
VTRSGRRLSTVVLLALAATAGVVPAYATSAQTPGAAGREVLLDLRPLPEPPLDRMDPEVAERLRELRSSLAADLADPSPDPARLTAGFARLGQLFLLYQLDQAARDCFWNARLLAPADARWAYYLGVASERLGERDAAVAAFETVLDARPLDEATLVRLGRLALESGDVDGAEKRFGAALDTDPASAAAHQGLGQVSAFREDWRAAVEHLARALELQPAATAIHYELGLAYRELGEMDLAREQMTQRGDAQPSFPDPLVDGLETLAPGAWQFRRRGGEAFARGDLAGAEAAYRQAIEANPDDAPAQEALGSVLALENRISEAISAYRRALELEPDDARAHHDLGRLMLRSGRPDDAIRHLRRAVELVPDYAAAYHDMAAGLEQRGRLAEAAEAAGHAVELLPESAGERLFFARLRLLASLDLRADPKEELRRALERDPRDGMALLSLGALAAAEGREDEALDAYRRVLGIEGADPETRAYRSRAHLLLARPVAAAGEATRAEAAEHLRAAARLTPDLAEVHLDLGRLLLAAGDDAGAAQAFRLALGIDPAEPEAIVGLARALLEQGRCVEAREHLARSVAAAPAATAPRELLARVRATCPAS